jgi:MFS family permease
MSLMKKRWAVLVASVIVNICIGTGFAWSVYQTGLFKEAVSIFGMEVSKSQLALAFTICSGVAPIPMIAGSGLQKKLKGPRNVVWLGGILFGIGLISTSFISSLPMLYVTYGLLCGFGIAFAYGITIGNTVRFFPDKRGLIAGISTAAYGAGSIIFPPVMQALISSYGVLATFRILGIVFIIVILVAACFISEPPEGWVPDGWQPKTAGTKNAAAAEPVQKNWKQMLADWRFYPMIIVFTIFATGGLMVVSQGSPMAQAIAGVDAATAATVVSIIALGNTGGRVLWGWVSDRIGRYPALMIMAVIIAGSGFALSALTSSGSLAVFVIFAILIAMCYGGSMGVYPALTSDAFGLKNNGVNYGIMFIGFALGGYIGPILANTLYDSTGSYAVPLLAVGAMGAVSLVLIFVLYAVNRREGK